VFEGFVDERIDLGEVVLRVRQRTRQAGNPETPQARAARLKRPPRPRTISADKDTTALPVLDRTWSIRPGAADDTGRGGFPRNAGG
jgi:hypothetical protein